MDEKAKLILSNYKIKLEELSFDELDILGFLIFIREYVRNDDFPSVHEFCNLIAHRNRDRGKVCRSIEVICNKNFNVSTHVDDKGKVKSSEGISEKDWKDEWLRIFSKFKIEFSDIILKELTLCIISLAQKTEYQSAKMSGESGSLEVFIDYKGNIDLCYRKNSPLSVCVTFLKGGQWILSDYDPQGEVDTPIITIRVNGQLRVKCGERFIV